MAEEKLTNRELVAKNFNVKLEDLDKLSDHEFDLLLRGIQLAQKKMIGELYEGLFERKNNEGNN